MSKKNKKENEPGKEKGKSPKIVLIVVAIIVGFALVAGAVFVGYMAATRNFNKINETEQGQEEEKVEEFTFEVKEFLVNLKDENKSKYLKIKIFLGGDLKNEDLPKELEFYKPQIEDGINKILRSKLAADFTPEGELQLKNEIKTNINGILAKGQITNVYFTDLIIQ